MNVPMGRLVDKWVFLVWSKQGPPSCTTRAVLYALSRFGGKDKAVVFPNETTIAEVAGVTEKTARKHLEMAEQFGWITITKNRGTGKAWAQKRYQFCWPPGFDPEKDEWLIDIKAKVDDYREESWIGPGE